MKSREDLTKHTLHLRRGDADRIRSLFPDLGYAIVIRTIVSNFLDKGDSERKELIKIKEIDL